VLLITDQTSTVGVTFANGGQPALVLGRGVNDPLAASAVQISSPLRPGAVFATDGLAGGLFPAGLPVATVRTITLTPGTSTYELTLRPASDLIHLSYVDVLLWEPAT
jgi:rod shape-determining protein MreC